MILVVCRLDDIVSPPLGVAVLSDVWWWCTILWSYEYRSNVELNNEIR